MSFFGFDTSLPGRDDDRFREGPTLGSLGGFEYEDEFELPGEEGDIQDYLATEEEADAANLDTFGELATPPDASGRDDGRVSQSERVQKIGKDFDFNAANKVFEQKVQEQVVPAPRQPRAEQQASVPRGAPAGSSIKALWDSQGAPASSTTFVRPSSSIAQDGLPLSTREGAKMFSASDIEAQLLGQSREIPQGRPVFPVHGGYPVSLPPPTAGVPPGIMSLDQVEAAMRQQAHQRQLEANRQAQIAMELAQRAKAAQQQQDFARDMMQRSMEDLALQQRQTMPSNHTDVGSGGHPDRLHSLPHGSGPLRPPGHVAGVRPVMSPGEVQIMARPPQKMSFGFGGGSGSRQGFDNRPDRHLQPMPGMRPAMSYGFRDQRGDYGHRSPQHFGSEEERRLAERKRHNERYNYIMETRDRELIARIQLSQLYSPDPMATDFYFQIYNLIKKQEARAAAQKQEESEKQGLTWQQEMLMSGGGTKRNLPFKVTDTMQRRVLEWIREREERQAKPKPTNAPLEHALGKVSLSSSKTPRQLLQVTALNPTKEGSGSPLSAEHPASVTRKYVGPLSSRGVLRRIESAYADVIELEQRRRSGPAEGESEEDFMAKNEELRQQLWEELEVTADVATDEPHPLIQFLGVAKAKKVLPRVMRQLSSERALAVFTILLSRLSELDVVRTPSKQLDADLFMDCCIPPLVTVVREVPLRIVNALLRVLLERNSLVDIAKSRIGLAIVTMLLGRAESVKGQTSAIEAGPHGLPSEQDLQIWSELYDYIFASLNGQLSSLFPPAGDRSLEQRAEQDTYVWQFLAAMAVGATTVDHQRSLVLDVRGKVLESARSGVPKDLVNCNLFLNALGLDSTMLTG